MIKIFTIFHQNEFHRPHWRMDNYEPLYAGLTTGKHIADLSTFGEMRGHYFVWKNLLIPDLTHVGFQHYRRWMYFKDFPQNVDKKISNPEKFREYVNAANPLPDSLRDYDIISAAQWQFPDDLGSYYSRAHDAAHWQALLQTIPLFAELAKNELCYNVCNIFLLRVGEFDRYMSFWWDVVQAVIPRITISDDKYQHRAIAFLSERIYSLWLKQEKLSRPELKIAEVPLIMNIAQ